MQWHGESVQAAAEKLKADARHGLSEKEAAKRLASYGTNQLEGKAGKGLLRKFIEQFSDFMVLILLAAAGLSFLISIWESSDFFDSIMILAIVCLNAVMGVMQEAKAERAIQSLQKLSAPKTRVIRGGQSLTVDSANVVPGDLLLFETGDAITADARLVEAVGLRVEESSLTGESLPVNKDPNVRVDERAPLAERRNMIFSGSTVVGGRCRAIAVETGMQTQVGQIASLLDRAETPDTPLQRRLSKTGRTLGTLAILICSFIFMLGVIYHTPLLDSFMLSVSLAVAAVPEGLPAIVTIVLALGVQRMARKNAIVRKLPAVETLGSATVICSDKTGTLTQNQMTVKQTRSAAENRRRLLLYGALCTNVTLADTAGRTHATGDPTETAIANAALAEGIALREELRGYPRRGEVPFDSARKYMGTLHKSGTDGGGLFIMKGAPDVLLGLCTRYDSGRGASNLTEQMRREILAQNAEMANDALRVIAVAYRDVPQAGGIYDGLEQELVFLGLIAMQDPPRPEAKEAVRVCKRAGIRPIMITGDHAATAAAIARELGILTRDSQVLTGADLDVMDEQALRRAVPRIAVFARVSPEHKSRVVRALQENGEIVAMTGDGVNDAPALKTADIGCAMGKTGTDVARDASDMILTDDNFATIVAAVRQGRSIYQNIVKSIHFLLSCNAGEIFVILFAILLGMPAPLLPLQLLWVNLVTDSLPALALGAEEADKDLMERPPLAPKSSMFADGLWFDILLQGLMIGGLTLLAFFLGLRAGDLATGRALAFAVLSLSQLVHAFNVRSRKSLFHVGVFSNRKMILAFVICAAMQVTVLCIPVLANMFGAVPLTFAQWGTVLWIAPLPLLIVELAKFARGSGG